MIYPEKTLDIFEENNLLNIKLGYLTERAGDSGRYFVEHLILRKDFIRKVNYQTSESGEEYDYSVRAVELVFADSTTLRIAVMDYLYLKNDEFNLLCKKIRDFFSSSNQKE